MKNLIYFVPVIVLAILGYLFFAGLRSGTGSEIPSALIDKPMPALPETTLEGYDPADTQALLSENPYILVNYFASWCAPCRAEHPILVKIQDMGVPIVGVNYMDKPDNARAFIEENGNPYIGIQTDPDGLVAINWGLAGVPESFLINEEGKVVKRFFGPITETILQDDLVPILNGS